MLMIFKSPSAKTLGKRVTAGFSLIEMAMVLLIVGLVLNGLFVSLGQSELNRRRSQTNAEMEQIAEAIYGFAQANGRLPCPATTTSAGDELPVYASPGGICTQYRGFVPGVRLGLQGSYNSQGLIQDPWGNPYRYVVAQKLIGANTSVLTTSTLLKQWFNGTTPTGNWICVSDAVDCGATVYANNIPALIYSMGADWQTTSSALQAENIGATVAAYAQANDHEFVDAPYSEDDTLYYDDQMVWLSPSILNSRLIDAGKLP